MEKFLILLATARLVYPFIYYDTGLARNFDYTFDTGFVCNFGHTRSATIPFSDTFEKIPQVFFTHEHFEQEMPQVGFKLSITTITQTWFEVETPNSHSQVWVAYQFTKSYKALECFSIRTSRKEVLDLNILPTFYLELVQLNKIYTTTGNYDYLVDKSTTQLKMILQVKCENNNKKIQADFNKCNSCSTKKTHSFTYNCFKQMNYVGFFPIFKQAFQQYNKLKISIQSSSLEITQILYDQSITEQSIVKIQILNQ
ncbi:unnamed protein product [Paramecium sonneborni]|uniref:H-type lectin domain-containing protein n=1 Tax=Paramecium sonneborni TaxID=65129 RepID=A0A8S1P3W7_9CILI|nr:unnamed protein product [Paramecium sonneborni]